MALFSGVLFAPAAHGQEATYFYSGGKKNALPVSTKWSAIQLEPGGSPLEVQKALRGAAGIDAGRAPVFYNRKKILALPLRTDATTATRGALRAKAKRLRGVRRALRAFGNGDKPILETDEFVVQFKESVSRQKIQSLLAAQGATIIRPLGRYASNGFLARILNSNGPTATDAANALYESADVVFAHPNFIWPKEPRFVPNDPLYPNQWHLNNSGQGSGQAGADVNAPEAWDISRGSSSITIAIIDDGIDLQHEDFRGKLVAGYDFAGGDSDPSAMDGDNHGTACAGVAAGLGNNGLGGSGMAPNVKIMPIRLIASGATLQDEADSFVWAADHGADVISCSWGPTDRMGVSQPLPDSTKAGIDHAATYGRGGKGCVILFASGNGNESSDLDGYSSYSRVISVAATTNYDLHAAYSDFGASVDIAAPSNGGSLGITTTDRSGTSGYSSNNYTGTFGGTSSSAPLAAGLAALVLSLEPNLTSVQVQQRLQSTADKVGGVTYDSKGHNTQLGYGRINALRALQAARTFSISGRVTLANGTGVGGVSVTTGAGGTAISAADGSYSMRAGAGATTVSAQKTGYLFSPASQSITVSANVANLNFTALPPPIPTLSSPQSGATISGVYDLRASTANDARVQRLEFARRLAPVTMTSDPNPDSSIPDARYSNGVTTPGALTTTHTFSTSGTAESASVEVHIQHGFVSDLTVTLIAPNGTRTVLHNREGGSTQNIDKTYPVTLANKTIAGAWRLEIKDASPGAAGTLASWRLTLNSTWTPIASDTDGASGGIWTAPWNTATTAQGIYEVRARAVASSGSFDDVNTDVSIVPSTLRTISGRLTNSAGGGIPGAAVTRTGSSVSAATDANGFYTLRDVAPGNYTITPQRAGTLFSPASQSITVSQTNVTEINFQSLLEVSISRPVNAVVYGSLPRAYGTARAASGASVSAIRCRLYRYATGSTPGGYWAGGSTWTTGYNATQNERLATGTTSWSLALPVFSATRYVLRVAAYDSAGRVVSLSPYFTFHPLPAITIAQPLNGGTYSSLPAINGTAKDGSGGSALNRVDLYLQRKSDNKYWTGTTWGAPTALTTTLSANSWTRSSGLPAGADLTSGSYFAFAYSFDMAQFRSIAASATFTVQAPADTVVPTVTLTTPANGTTVSSLPSISGTAADNSGNNGLDRVALYLQRKSDFRYWTGSAWGTTTPSPLTTSLSVNSWTRSSSGLPSGANLTAGSYYAYAYSYDKAGNRSTPATSTFTVAATAARTQSNSNVGLSSASVDADGSIALRFTGALDTGSAIDIANYALEVNGAFASLDGASLQNGVVSLFPTEALPRRAEIIVRWNGLRDANGNMLASGNVAFSAP